MKKEILNTILSSRIKKQPLAIITNITDGTQWAFAEGENENAHVFTAAEIDTIKKSIKDFLWFVERGNGSARTSVGKCFTRTVRSSPSLGAQHE